MFNIKFYQSPYQGNWSSIEYELTNNWLDLRPKYQRNFVWSKRFQRELIISIFAGYPIGSIIRRKQDQTRKIEIVDGQQRLTTIQRFVNGELFLASTHSEKAKEILNLRDGNYEKYTEEQRIYKFLI